MTLNGHKGAVTVLRYNKLGSLFASGSKDNDVILWDMIGETGLFRLCGHRDQVLLLSAFGYTPCIMVVFYLFCVVMCIALCLVGD